VDLPPPPRVTDGPVWYRRTACFGLPPVRPVGNAATLADGAVSLPDVAFFVGGLVATDAMVKVRACAGSQRSIHTERLARAVQRRVRSVDGHCHMAR
jgi:hypothetical protein